MRGHYSFESLLGPASLAGRGFLAGLELFKLESPGFDFAGLDTPRLMRKNFSPLRNELATLIFFDLFRRSSYRSPGLLAAGGTGPVVAGAPRRVDSAPNLGTDLFDAHSQPIFSPPAKP